MSVLRALGVTLLFLILTACAHGHGIAGNDQSGGRPEVTYVVTGVTDAGKPRPVVAGSQIRVQFHAGRIVVTAGCNTMSGSYRVSGTRLRVDSLAMTEMGCRAPLMAQDTWVAGLFAKPVQFTTGKDAAITSGAVVLSLADRRTVSPGLPLVGTKWLLDTVYDGGTASSVPSGDVAWVVFDDRGAVSVNDGLNDGSGPVSVDGARITFGNLGWTAVGCTATCTVGDFSDIFSGTSTFTITEKRLTLTQGTHGLGFRAVARLPRRD
ncbi:MAG: protein of unknown function Meta and HslJ [Marmoricola sp.]|nr:protein of unknown function Meta and HslJ [Marmoricola sp.]